MAHGKYEKTNIARSIERDSTVLGCLLYHNHLHVTPKRKIFINNEKTKFMRQVTKVDLV
jgi:hypothetical protein